MDLFYNFPDWPDCQVCNKVLEVTIIRKPLYCVGCKQKYKKATFHTCCAKMIFTDYRFPNGINSTYKCCRCTTDINKMYVNIEDVCKYLLKKYRPSYEEIGHFFGLTEGNIFELIELDEIINNIDTVENYAEKYNCDKDIIKKLCENICVTNNLDIKNIREIIMNERARGSGHLTKRAVK